MNLGKVRFYLISIVILACLLLAACDGAGGISLRSQDHSPEPTDEVVVGKAGDDESLGSDEDTKQTSHTPCMPENLK